MSYLCWLSRKVTYLQYFLFSSSLCTLDEDKSFCKGDVGSPLVTMENGRYVLIGLASWGADCPGDSPNVFARVTSKLSWILDKTNINLYDSCSELINQEEVAHEDGDPLPLIAGLSSAGLVLFLVTIIIVFCCWKKKCSDSAVVEENEMYGPAQEYDQYDKDAYDTRVVDNNDDYYEYDDGIYQ